MPSKKKDKDEEIKEQQGEEAAPAEPCGEEQPPAEPELSEQEVLQKKYDELNDRYLRLMAEYDNFRKRSVRERDEIYPSATAAALEKFLPLLDTFERAEGFERDTEDFSKGFDMLAQNFRDVIASFGVEPVGEVGEPFDPDLHNAVMHIEDEALGENVVAQVLQKGYKMGGRVIRYAMVQTAN